MASLEQYIMVYDLLQHHLLKGTTIRYKGKPPHPSGVGSVCTEVGTPREWGLHGGGHIQMA